MNVFEFFKNTSFEKRVKIFSIISLFSNVIICIAKFIAAAIFNNYFLIVAGFFNIFIFLSKGECLLGLMNNNRSFKFRNTLIFLFVLTAGIVYTVYSARLVIYNDYATYNFSMELGILIALVSFIELIVAIYGLFRVKKYGHFYRDIKIINFITALTAIVLTEAAITSFANAGIENTKQNNGIFGMIVGIFTIVMSIYIFFAPVISVIDREHRCYKVVDEEKTKIYFNESNILELPLSFTKIFNKYVFKAYLKNGKVDGHIELTSGFFKRSNIYVKVFLIIFFPIYMIPLAFARLFYFFRTINIPKKLDKIMEAHGFEKISN